MTVPRMGRAASVAVSCLVLISTGPGAVIKSAAARGDRGITAAPASSDSNGPPPTAPGVATGQPVYCLRDLGLLVEDDPIYPTALNERGDVVGNSISGKAFLYREGQLLLIEPAAGDDMTAVFAISGSGVIVGNSVSIRSDDTGNHPFTYHEGRTTSLAGIADGIPYAISDDDQIVGATRELGAFLYRQGSLSVLGKPGSVAYGINNTGEVVGVTDEGKAFVFRDGTMRSLGTLADHDYSEARDISDSGSVIGFSGSVGITNGEAFIFNDKYGMKGLGKIKAFDNFSVAMSIDKDGNVVGYSGSSHDFLSTSGLRAFLFKDEKMFDLNMLAVSPPDVTLTAAVAINDRGQIAARGAANDRLHSFLLTPRHEGEDCDPSGPRP